MEMRIAEKIHDKQEREHRLWQIECAMQEAIVFNNRFRELVRLGMDPFETEKISNEELLKKREEIANAKKNIGKPQAINTPSMHGDALTRGVCSKCKSPLYADLEFCGKCGHK